MIEAVEEFKQVTLDMQLNDVPLSTRARGCLSDIKTVKDLVKETPQTLMGRKNLGKKVLDEIQTILQENNLSLSGGEPQDCNLDNGKMRDKFAMHIMCGLLSSESRMKFDRPEYLAGRAYELADALVKARDN